MGYYLQRLTRIAWWRGIHERSSGWLYVGVALTVVRVVVRVARRALAEPAARAVVDVAPGDALEIRVVDPHPR